MGLIKLMFQLKIVEKDAFSNRRAKVILYFLFGNLLNSLNVASTKSGGHQRISGSISDGFLTILSA